jgi:hypothetical protein
MNRQARDTPLIATAADALHRRRMDPADIRNDAIELIRQHGADGALFAALRRIQDLGDVGDAPGIAMWHQIMDVIEAARRTAPSEGEAIL